MRAYVGLGANLGDREGTIRSAVALLGTQPGIDVVAVSSLRETEPVGYVDQPAFLNGAVAIDTGLDPRSLTLEITEGLRRPDEGEVRLLGESPFPRNPALLRRIGVQLQASAFFEKLSAREQIHTFASLYGVSAERADAMLETVGLTEKAGTREDRLSGGQAFASTIRRTRAMRQWRGRDLRY